MESMNSYELSRAFWDYAFENPEKIKPIHSSIYFFSIEHCNRLGWKQKFGLPSQMVMEAIGVKNWRTYSKGLNDLVEWGFLEMIEKSVNQYSSNIVAIVNFTKADTKALDKALSKHGAKQSQSIVSIDKQLNKEQENKQVDEGKPSTLKTLNDRKIEFGILVKDFVGTYSDDMCKRFFNYWTESNVNGKKMRFEMEKVFDLKRRLATWAKNDKEWNKSKEPIQDKLVEHVKKATNT